jgi:hypothetical protein
VVKSTCQAQCDGFEAFTMFCKLVTVQLLPVSAIESVLKGQQFLSAEEVTAKATRALTDQKEHWQSMSLPKGTTLKEVLCKYMLDCLFLCNKPILETF